MEQWTMGCQAVKACSEHLVQEVGAGMQLQSYRYYDPKTCGFDFTGAIEDISVSVALRAGGRGNKE